MEHAKRSHALLSASGAHRWIACTPSARLEEPFPDTTSEAAREGTLAHELAELKVRHYVDTTNFGKRKLTTAVNKLKKDPLWQEEMQGYTDVYLDYIKSAALSFAAQPSVEIEKRVRFAPYTHKEPGDEVEGSGIADCVMLGDKTLWVIDFKYGQSPDGRVSAEGNPQLSLYALGAYESYRILYQIERVKMSIVQPRLPDGISEWECSLDELLAWGEYVKGRAELAWAGEGTFAPSEKTCRYCRAKARCRARAEENVKLAFDVPKMPPLISNAEVGKYLTQGEDVAKWLKDLQEYALKACLAGEDVPGWKAVEGRSSREWSDMDQAFETLERHGVPEAVLWERKPLTLAQVEKAVGKKDFASYVGTLVVKKPGRPALVKESDKREAITNRVSAAEAFKEEERDG